ncbi:uncharacterized protein [Oscarella lobularis]|uniref:uncharacterized protein isoform X2 n=1 Tax=Oscarella lobularis TaxID=121494 RepID=UPI0033132D43
MLLIGLVLVLCASCYSDSPSPPTQDPRYLSNGSEMLVSGYLDQPYCVVDASRARRWVCTITQDSQHEGGQGERVVSLFSSDKGKTWSHPLALEPNTSLANSYSTILITPAGRIYAIYNMNLDNVTMLPSGKPISRSDELGHFVMRYSDDGGESWSSERYEVPYRLTSIDESNSWLGKVKIMWTVDQSKVHEGILYFSFTKIGIYPQNAPEEVWFMRSENIMTEEDPMKIKWDLLPEGDHGIPPPGGNPNIAEEGHILPLSTGGFYAVFRTTQGYLGASCSPAGMHASHWNPPSFAEYWDSTPQKRLYLKNPRGPITMKQFSNGMYLLLYYNNGETGFTSRNPYWLSSGILNSSGDGILWSQPEIILYERDPSGRPGYPDFIEDELIYITETQKTTARVHQIDPHLLKLLFQQRTVKLNPMTTEGIVSTFNSTEDYTSSPRLPDFSQYKYRQGVTIDLWIERHSNSSPGQKLLDSRNAEGQGIYVVVGADHNITVGMKDSSGNEASHGTDSTCTAALMVTGLHHIAVVIDNGPFLMYFIVDGLVCDGGRDAAVGFKWITNSLSDINGSPKLFTAPDYTGVIRLGHIYNVALLTSEVIGLYRNGL